jgi:myosin heavy subunit
MLTLALSSCATEKYFLKEAKDYHYLNQSDVYTLPNVDDKHDWERMRVCITTPCAHPSPDTHTSLFLYCR